MQHVPHLPTWNSATYQLPLMVHVPVAIQLICAGNSPLQLQHEHRRSRQVYITIAPDAGAARDYDAQPLPERRMACTVTIRSDEVAQLQTAPGGLQEMHTQVQAAQCRGSSIGPLWQI